MIVIKKSGKKEEFLPEKISRSIAAASDEAKEFLTESDLRIVLTDLRQIVSGKDLITSQQIDVIVSGILYLKGYFGTLDKYVSYHKQQDNNL